MDVNEFIKSLCSDSGNIAVEIPPTGNRSSDDEDRVFVPSA